MTYKSDMHLIILSVRKGFSTAVVASISDKVAGKCQILYGSNIPNEHKAGLLGITLKEEDEMIITVVHTSKLDEVLQTAIEVGGLNTPQSGMCMTIPLDRMYIADTIDEKPSIPTDAPADLVHPKDEN